MERPAMPAQEDCCNSGCNPCIFDVYEKQLKLHESQLKGKQDIKLLNLISETKYTKFNVVKIINLNINHKLIVFQYSDVDICNFEAHRLHFEPTQYFLLRLQTEDIHTTKPYTPLKLELLTNSDDPKYTLMCFRIIVKIYDGGLFSRYLYNLEIGECTLWRGPYGVNKYISNKYCKIFFITQGTGIVGVYELITNILENEDDTTVLHMFCCYKNYATILFRNELYNMKAYWNFNYDIYLSNTENFCFTPKYLEPIRPYKFNFAVLNKELINTDSTGFYLCGSNEFMSYYKEYLITKGVDSDDIVSLES